jgi:hypothetical protein
VILPRDLFGVAFASVPPAASALPATSIACAAAASNDDNSICSDENLTLTELGKHADNNKNFKTTGDMEFTTWQVLRSEMSDLAVVDCDYLQGMRMREKVPIAYCMNVKDITKVQSLVPMILVRVTK